ncbi:MAG: hypothetical protein ACFE9T_08055 [Promethearchaeota archaeon]
MYNFWAIFIVIAFILFIIILIIYICIRKLHKASKKPEKKEKILYLKCLDGHIVRSKGELIIDNYLYFLGLNHKYEKTIKINGKKIKYDWYLPEFQIYIEYWGYYGKEYMKRKREKIKLYKKGKLSLISIENGMFKDIYSSLNNKFRKLIKLNKKNKITAFCPSCGIELDERFQNNLNFV